MGSSSFAFCQGIFLQFIPRSISKRPILLCCTACEGWLGNLSQNFIMIVYLLCSNQGFPVQEQNSNYQARSRAVTSPL